MELEDPGESRSRPCVGNKGGRKEELRRKACSSVVACRGRSRCPFDSVRLCAPKRYQKSVWSVLVTVLLVMLTCAQGAPTPPREPRAALVTARRPRPGEGSGDGPSSPYASSEISLVVRSPVGSRTGVASFDRNTYKLTSIVLSGCKKITDEGLKALAQSCAQLTGIGLLGCGKITDEGLKALSQSCVQFTSIVLSGCKKITKEGLKALARNCIQFTSIVLAGCKKITNGAPSPRAE